MVKIKDITRTATFAWSQDSLPLLATGTVAGAVDVDFNSTSALELWDLFSATNEKEPFFSAQVENRFFALAWSKPFEGRPRGLLVGAFENGVVEFWDADVLIRSKDLAKASVKSSDKHSGSVRCLQFNPNESHILVSGGSNGEIFIWDTKKFTEPVAPGQAMTPMDEITSVAWNNSVSHIFASTGNSGYTSIWDMKSKREVLHLSYSGPTGKANFSQVAWHPSQSTKLITASDNDSCPLILTWDLRNSNAPEKILEGHKKGVLSLDWCKQDPELLLSSGKDNTTYLWNPITGQKLGEYPTTANWAFKTGFAQSAPDIFATASFDGKLVVQTLQDTTPPVASKVTSNDDNEFWSEISTTDTQQPKFELTQAPKWLKRPVSASFGFGSKVVTVKKDKEGKSVVSVSKLILNNDTANVSLIAMKQGDINSIIDSKSSVESVNEHDGADWSILKKLADQGKDKLLDFPEEGRNLETRESENNTENTLNSKGDSFFDNLGNDSDRDDEIFFSGNFSIFKNDYSEIEKSLVRHVLSNNIEDAVSVSLKEGKLLQALVLSLDASDEVKRKVKKAFFKENSNDDLSRIIYSASFKDAGDLVSNADVAYWKEIAIGINSFSADKSAYNSKITELGDRILSASKSEEARNNAISCYLAGDAVDKVAGIWLNEISYLESKLLKSTNNSKIASPSDARFEALNNFVEKLYVCKQLAFNEKTFSGPSVEPIAKAVLEYVNMVTSYGEFDLAEKFLNLLPAEYGGSEHERIAKATEQTTTTKQTASKNKAYKPNVQSHASYASVSSSRNLNSASHIPRTNHVTPASARFNPPTPGIASSPIVPDSSFSASDIKSAVQAPVNLTSASAYHKSHSSNPYAPPQQTKPQNLQEPFLNNFGSPAIPNHANSTSKPDAREGWNDLPPTFKAASGAARRPAAVATASPTPSTLSSPPMQAPGIQRKVSVGPTSNSVLPPPPKGISRTSSRASFTTQQAHKSATSSPRQAHSQINNRYAPPVTAFPNDNNLYRATGSVNSPTSTPPPPPPPPAAPKNPYSIPNPTPPIKNAYAPPVAPQTQNNGPSTPGPIYSSISTPKNPYAPPTNGSVPTTTSPRPLGGLAPPPLQGGIAPPPVHGGIAPPPVQGGIAPPPPQGGVAPPPPPIASGSLGAHNISKQPAASQPVEPSKPRYPKGDRSHIPQYSLPIYDSLESILDAIKPSIPERFEKQAKDMERRLGLLYDLLNNDDLSDDAVASLKLICSAIKERDFPNAAAINVDLATTYNDKLDGFYDCHVGIKRLITIAEAIY